MADGLGNGLAGGGVAAAVGLMYTAAERFAGAAGELRAWSDLGVVAEAQAAWRERERSQGSMIVGMGRGGSGVRAGGVVSGIERFRYFKGSDGKLEGSWWPAGVSSGGAPVAGTGALPVEEMLRPGCLLSDAAFSAAGIRVVAGRRAIELSAVPRRQWHEHTGGGLWDGPEEFRLLVDAERGVLLSATSWFQGRAMAGRDAVSVNFDGPLPPEDGRRDGIGEVAGLLYGAQHSFAAVRATVREWRAGGNVWHRLAAVNPCRLRKESISSDGRRLDLAVYDGGVWWRYSAAARVAETNAPMPSLPPEYNARFSPHPFTPGDAVYQILDGEYAIIAAPWLNPSHLLYCWRLDPAGRTALAGREAIRVRGEANHDNGPRYWWEKINECELLVDAERGTLLRLAGIVDGREVAGHEVTAIEFDGAVAPAEFGFTPPDGAAVRVGWWSDRPLPPPPSFGLG